MIPITEELIEKARLAKEILATRLKNPPSLFELADLCRSNRSSIQIAFKAVFSQTVGQASKEFRMERAKFLLLNTNKNLDKIAHETGYFNAANFSRYFKKHFGVNPGNSGKGEGRRDEPYCIVYGLNYAQIRI